LISDFVEVCSQYKLTWFQFDGYGHFESTSNNGVAFVNIDMPPIIKNLRWELVRRLGDYCNLNREFDLKKENYRPHATVAMKLSPWQLRRVNSYLKTRRAPKKHYYFARATLLKNGKILREYDFALKRALNRSEALDKRIMRQTLNAIGESTAEPASTGSLISRLIFGGGVLSIVGAVIIQFTEGIVGLDSLVAGVILAIIGVILFYLARKIRV
jgi:hypothetical protein